LADKDSTEARVKRTLNEAQLTERRDLLGQFIHEKSQIEEKKSAQVEKWNAQLKTLDQQIHTIGIEVYEKAAWIPAQMALGEDGVEDLHPGVSGRAAKKTKKKAGKRRARSNGADAQPVATDVP
jgi:hypothetical protein